MPYALPMQAWVKVQTLSINAQEAFKHSKSSFDLQNRVKVTKTLSFLGTFLIVHVEEIHILIQDTQGLSNYTGPFKLELT